MINIYLNYSTCQLDYSDINDVSTLPYPQPRHIYNSYYDMKMISKKAALKLKDLLILETLYITKIMKYAVQ